MRRTAPVDLGHCDRHGLTELRLHRYGRYSSWVCPRCHSMLEAARKGGLPRPDVTRTVVRCFSRLCDVSGQPCRRPDGHPAAPAASDALGAA